LPAYSVATSLILFGLLVIWQPLAAQEQDVQAQLKELRDLLARQQEELAAQRILIEQLQGSQPAAKTGPHTAAVAKPTVDSTVAAQQPGTDTPPAKADQSGQQQAVEALAQQQQVAPETSQEKYAAVQKKILNDPSNTIYDPDFPGAWYLPGTTAAMKVGGYVDLSIVNSFDPMLQPDWFIVGCFDCVHDFRFYGRPWFCNKERRSLHGQFKTNHRRNSPAFSTRFMILVCRC